MLASIAGDAAESLCTDIAATKVRLRSSDLPCDRLNHTGGVLGGQISHGLSLALVCILPMLAYCSKRR